MEYLQEAREICQEYQLCYDHALTLINLGIASTLYAGHGDREQYDSARCYLDEARSRLEDLGMRRELITVHVNLGDLGKEIGNLGAAYGHFKEAACWSERSAARRLTKWMKRRSSVADGPGVAEAGADTASVNVEFLQDLARQTGAVLLTLRMTPWGACCVAVTPDGRIATHLFDGLSNDEFLRLLVEWYQGYEESLRKLDSMDPLEDPTYRSDMVANWREVIDSVMGRLGEKLGRPLHEWLKQCTAGGKCEGQPQPLVVMAGQGFNLLPLHAMSWKDCARRHWACDYYQFSYVPNCQVLAHCLRHGQSTDWESSRLLMIRNPTANPDGSGGLPIFKVLGDKVAQLFHNKIVLGQAGHMTLEPATFRRLTGSDGRQAWGRGELENSDIVVFATHGHHNPENPWDESVIKIACDGDISQANLPLAEVFKLDLSQLKLAVMAACETAIPEATDPTNEHVSLPAAFLAAGAGAALGTLWRVQTGPTTFLIHRFFVELLGNDSATTDDSARVSFQRGLCALWKAQQWLRGASRQELNELLQDIVGDVELPETAGSQPYAHPYYWSAFAWSGAP